MAAYGELRAHIMQMSTQLTRIRSALEAASELLDEGLQIYRRQLKLYLFLGLLWLLYSAFFMTSVWFVMIWGNIVVVGPRYYRIPVLPFAIALLILCPILVRISDEYISAEREKRRVVLWKIHIDAGLATLKMAPLLIIPLAVLLLVNFTLIGVPVRLVEELLRLVTFRMYYILDMIQILRILTPFQAFVLTGCIFIYFLLSQVHVKHRIIEGMFLRSRLARHRFLSNVLVWWLAALLICTLELIALLGASILSVLLTPGGFNSEEPSTVGSIAGLLFFLIGCIFPIPLIYIWMRLLYYRNLAAHDGTDLATRIATWQQQGATPGADSDLRTTAIPHTIA